MLEFDAKKLRAAFSCYMTGVTVVTAKANNGSHVGFTANSFTSVSLEPPLLLVCPGNHLSSFDVFEATDHFAVNILAEDQEAISNHFASTKGDRFANINWSEDAFGSPIIEGAAAHFSCSTFRKVDAGDHIILVGQVEAFQNGQRNGLGYSNSGYFNLNAQNRLPVEQSEPTQCFAGALVEYDGKLLITDPDGVFSLPMIALADRYRAPLAVSEYLANNGVEADIRQTYSVFDGAEKGEQYVFFRASASSVGGGKIGQFVEIGGLDETRFDKPGFADMIRRFKSEFSHQEFGLFIGNAVAGEVHSAPAS